MIVSMALALIAAAGPERCAQVSDRKVCLEGPAERGLPLVIYLHGYGGKGDDDALGLRALAQSQRFLYAAPDAPMNQHDQRDWKTPEVVFLHDLIPKLVAAGSADAKRVYVAGFSLGGFRALDLACLRPEGIAAVVSVSGTRLEPAAKCVPGSVSTLHVHGEEDSTIVPAGGISHRTGLPYLSARAAAGLAAEGAGCKTGLSPAFGPPGIHVERASGCRDGAVVELWRVPRMGHSSRVPPRALWDFLKEHSR